MSVIPVQQRRMRDADLATYKGPEGEIVWNIDTKRSHYQDGVTAGGWPGRLLNDKYAGELRYDAAQTLTSAQSLQALSNLGLIYEQYQLQLSGSNVVLAPVNGGLLTINNIVYQIPTSGVVLPVPASLAVGNWIVYAYWAAATQSAPAGLALEFSAVGSTSNASGQLIKSGDPSRVRVGYAYARATGSIINDASGQHLRSHRNRQPIVVGSTTTGTPATASTSPVQTWGSVSFVAFSDEIVSLDLFTSAYFPNGTGGATFFIGTDNTLRTSMVVSQAQSLAVPTMVHLLSGFSEGIHLVQPFFQVNTSGQQVNCVQASCYLTARS